MSAAGSSSGSPSSSMRPSSIGSRPARQRNRVVLPEPFGSEDGDGLAALGGELDVEAERAERADDPGVEGHAAGGRAAAEEAVAQGDEHAEGDGDEHEAQARSLRRGRSRW